MGVSWGDVGPIEGIWGSHSAMWGNLGGGVGVPRPLLLRWDPGGSWRRSECMWGTCGATGAVVGQLWGNRGSCGAAVGQWRGKRKQLWGGCGAIGAVVGQQGHLWGGCGATGAVVGWMWGNRGSCGAEFPHRSDGGPPSPPPPRSPAPTHKPRPHPTDHAHRVNLSSLSVKRTEKGEGPKGGGRGYRKEAWFRKRGGALGRGRGSGRRGRCFGKGAGLRVEGGGA